MMIEDLIIIIPTHNRQHYLKRVFKYYSSFPCKVYICDSSKEKGNVESNGNIIYRWVPQSYFYGKILSVINDTTADYYALSPDDDFLNKTTLLENLSFLKTHNEFSFGNGRQIIFKKNDSSTFLTSNSFNKLQGIDSIKAKNDKAYLEYFFHHYQNILWSLFRKDTIKDAFESLNHCNYCNGNFVELILAIEGLRHGMVHISDKGYNYREIIEGEHWGSSTPSITLANIKNDEALKKDIKKFKQYYQNDGGFAETCLKIYLHSSLKDRALMIVQYCIKKLFHRCNKGVNAVVGPQIEVYNDPFMADSIKTAME